ncbi:uncharacterized protein BDR25DRAFT_357293 [Lindgomyces ingoldianus]|uniref:Uncharacterized protein n=1 Tax=Lindgomyces ingoldianus TaxID=673940 RepID=A0ACB6QPJ8_9PLEO|nr:uncharacterized protein BDR25DRAFT_357293 [Lindgomyces ingoldianus]KAF2468944.1 hypothetical protein BDR25DRAFT_357293 [Lindgomyces ingoldianus]
MGYPIYIYNRFNIPNSERVAMFTPPHNSSIVVLLVTPEKLGHYRVCEIFQLAPSSAIYIFFSLQGEDDEDIRTVSSIAFSPLLFIPHERMTGYIPARQLHQFIRVCVFLKWWKYKPILLEEVSDHMSVNEFPCYMKFGPEGDLGPLGMRRNYYFWVFGLLPMHFYSLEEGWKFIQRVMAVGEMGLYHYEHNIMKNRGGG